MLLVAFDTDSLVEHLIAGAAAGGFFLIAAIVYPAGMGMGDVKLAGVMGLFLGPRGRARDLRRADRRHASSARS